MYLSRISLAKVKKSIKNNKKRRCLLSISLASQFFRPIVTFYHSQRHQLHKRFYQITLECHHLLYVLIGAGSLIQSAPAHTMNDTFSSIILHSSASDRVLKAIDRLILRPAPCEQLIQLSGLPKPCTSTISSPLSLV